MFFVNKAHWYYYCRNSDSRIYIVISPVADPNGIHVLTTFVSIFSLQNSKNIHIFCYKRDPFTRYKHTIKMCQLPACANFCGLQHTKISPSYTRLFVVDSDWCDSVWTSDKLPVLKNCLKILTSNWHSWLNMLESYYVPWKKKDSCYNKAGRQINCHIIAITHTANCTEGTLLKKHKPRQSAENQQLHIVVQSTPSASQFQVLMQYSPTTHDTTVIAATVLWY